MEKIFLGLVALLSLAMPINAQNAMKTKESIRQTAGRNALGEFAPEFALLFHSCCSKIERTQKRKKILVVCELNVNKLCYL